MSEMYELCQHKAYLECVFGDGYAGLGADGGEVIVSIGPDGAPVPREQWTGRSVALVVGWRVACECPGVVRGWVSAMWVRVPSVALEDLRARRVHCPDEDTWRIDERDDVDSIAWQEWFSRHVRPSESMQEVRAAQADLARATARLDEGVRAAREVGVTWAVIGEAVGVARQSAHQRWGSGPSVRQERL